MVQENLTPQELIEKYHHLAEMHLEEYLTSEAISEVKEKNKKLLLD